MLTPGENYYRLFEGKMPEYVPIFDMMPSPGYVPAAVMAGPSCIDFHGPEGGKDPWGVEYITNAETGYSAIPKTWDFLLKNICDWRKVIKNPNLDDIDWKTMAEKDSAFMKDVFKIDRDQTLLLHITGGGFFQDLMGFMGFTEGLCAMIEEPDEVKALFEYITDYYLKLQHKIIQYYSPEVIYLLDDTASKLNPFISKTIFRDELLPFYKVLTDDAKDHGLPVQFHNCGRCEDFLQDYVDIGVKVVDPAQTMNNLDAIKKKYGRNLAVAGCWDWVVPSTWPVVDEVEIRKSVRESIDRYAPGGGFAMCSGGNVLGVAGDELPGIIRGWVMDEATQYGADFYKNHPEA